MLRRRVHRLDQSPDIRRGGDSGIALPQVSLLLVTVVADSTNHEVSCATVRPSRVCDAGTLHLHGLDVERRSKVVAVNGILEQVVRRRNCSGEDSGAARLSLGIRW